MFHSERQCAWQAWHLVFGFTANGWMNAVIVHELCRMLQHSHMQQHCAPPTAQQVLQQVTCVCLCASLLAVASMWNIFGSHARWDNGVDWPVFRRHKMCHPPLSIGWCVFSGFWACPVPVWCGWPMKHWWDDHNCCPHWTTTTIGLALCPSHCCALVHVVPIHGHLHHWREFGQIPVGVLGRCHLESLSRICIGHSQCQHQTRHPTSVSNIILATGVLLHQWRLWWWFSSK